MQNLKPKYHLMAFDKDAGIYDKITSGNFPEVFRTAKNLCRFLKRDALRSVSKEPYDWLEIWEDSENGTKMVIKNQEE